MKLLADQDYYEVLEIRRGASSDEIERAYRLAQSTYTDDSLAGYSVFERGDADAIREQLEIAYSTLVDAAAREVYDSSLGIEGTPAAAVQEYAEPPAPAAEPAAEPGIAALDALENLDDEEGEYDGPRLRRLRLQQGVDLDEIARATKISSTYLSFIEEERFDDLPAAVYVRGFVMGYATVLSLDAKRIARSYMKRYEESGGHQKRSMFSRH